MQTGPAGTRTSFLMQPLIIVAALLWVSRLPASMCDDPALLPVNHADIARCTVVTKPNVSGKALITLESADVCVVKGRDSDSGDNEASDRGYGRGNVYYIGGRIGFTDQATGEFTTLENFGQYWSNKIDPTFLSCIFETPFSLPFFEWASCGLGQIKRYRTRGWLDRGDKTLRYVHVNCYGQIELDFELQCH